ncbi:hypothetical protein Adu01nite_47810 [Paractinoplanes durhamensis]|uniref:Hsp70 protein n=1 Tax=Paractinoplanes durhamensis TaxID=113563 RepID=A0ABQ3Z0S4_9ACTN|nr:hypothetical protein Adu01nite_47810 [Actinoplanes durhamensis]
MAVLTLDGCDRMSTAVHVGDAGMVAGAAAWQRATTEPDGFVLSPLRAGTGKVTVGGSEVEVVDLVAVTLRHVAAVAQQVAGLPVDEVCLVVPAGWGPRRRTWLRHAARTAGLPVSRLIAAPIAALDRLDPDSGAKGLQAGPVMLVVDVGAGCETTLVQRGPAGGEVLATLADPDAGGDRLDAVLLETWTGTSLDDLPADSRWPTLANVRAARLALSEQPAVSMPMPDGPPLVVNYAAVADASRPVLEHAGELAAQVLEAADLTLDQVGGVFLIGGTAAVPAAADMIGVKLGATPQLMATPHLSAVLGAAGADPTRTAATGDNTQWELPPLRRLFTLALPGLVSLALYAHFVLAATFNNGTPTRPGPGYYVQASWGELTLAALLAAICFLQAASLIATLLDRHTPDRPGQPRGRITAGIGLAIAAGLATDALYAVTAALFFNHPMTDLLGWAILPVLPVAATAAVVAVLAWRRRSPPAGGWDGLLTFPASSIITAAVGILAVSLWWHGGLPWWLNDWTTSLGLAGGLLIAVAVACTLTRHPAARLALTLGLGFFTTIISRAGPDILAVIYATAVTCWWAWHAWTLIRTPPPRH